VKLSRSDLIALARKYRVLSELRRAPRPDSALELRGTLQRLSAEFPGALRELDILPLDEIERRCEALSAAAYSGDIEAWMGWMHAYHSLMRAAIELRRTFPGYTELEFADMERICVSSSHRDPSLWDAEFVRAVLAPPGGRMNAVVFRRLQLTFGESERVIMRTLFPEHRPAKAQ
jgi:hypothetical protein